MMDYLKKLRAQLVKAVFGVWHGKEKPAKTRTEKSAKPKRDAKGRFAGKAGL